MNKNIKSAMNLKSLKVIIIFMLSLPVLLVTPYTYAQDIPPSAFGSINPEIFNYVTSLEINFTASDGLEVIFSYELKSEEVLNGIDVYKVHVKVISKEFSNDEMIDGDLIISREEGEYLDGDTLVIAPFATYTNMFFGMFRSVGNIVDNPFLDLPPYAERLGSEQIRINGQIFDTEKFKAVDPMIGASSTEVWVIIINDLQFPVHFRTTLENGEWADSLVTSITINNLEDKATTTTTTSSSTQVKDENENISTKQSQENSSSTRTTSTNQESQNQGEEFSPIQFLAIGVIAMAIIGGIIFMRIKLK